MAVTAEKSCFLRMRAGIFLLLVIDFTDNPRNNKSLSNSSKGYLNGIYPYYPM